MFELPIFILDKRWFYAPTIPYLIISSLFFLIAARNADYSGILRKVSNHLLKTPHLKKPETTVLAAASHVPGPTTYVRPLASLADYIMTTMTESLVKMRFLLGDSSFTLTQNRLNLKTLFRVSFVRLHLLLALKNYDLLLLLLQLTKSFSLTVSHQRFTLLPVS